MKSTKTLPIAESAPLPVGSVRWLGADLEIKKIFDRLQESYDVSWTELAIMTAKEYAESLRVPQYDRELRLAESEIEKWKGVARQLHMALGCRKAEKLRVCAEHAYLNAQAPNDRS
jgi:hypothetical protein